jgi:6-pyruvoyl-tetrahydropterin synthase related domain
VRFSAALRDRLPDGLTLILITALACQPLFTGMLPDGADALLHLYRVSAIDAFVQQGGGLFARWLPGMAFGYGYPIFNFYPPLPHYIAWALHQIGFSISGAIAAIYVLATLLGALGIWRCCAQWLSRPAAPIGALAWALAPYTLYNMGSRMALAESVALAFVPLTLWALERATTLHAHRYALLAALGFAGVLLSHNITAMLAGMLFAATVAVLAVRAQPRFAVIRPVAGLALGLGLSAFFWLPAFLERDLTRLDAALGTAYDFRAAWLHPSTLFAWPTAIDSAVINDQTYPALSWVVLGLAAVGLLQRTHRWLWLCAAAAAGCISMTLPLSASLWDALPLLRFVLYPSRWLGLAAIFLALLAAAGASQLLGQAPSRLRSSLVLGVISLALAGYAFFWQFPARLPADLDQSAAGLRAAERRLGIVGTTSIGEYAPAQVQAWPANDAHPDQPFRIDSGGSVTVTQRRPLDITAEVTLLTAGTVTFEQFDFPGWQVLANGAALAHRATVPEGLISFDLPPGQHTLRVTFGSTPIRDVGNTVSAIALVAACVVFLRTGRRPGRSAIWRVGDLSTTLVPILALALVTKTLWIDQVDTPWRAAGPSYGAQSLAVFGTGWGLLDTSRAQHNPTHNSVEVSLFWRNGSPMTEDLGFNIKLVDALGGDVLSLDRVHPAAIYPTSRLRASQIVRDDYTLALPPGTPPGRYTIRVATYVVGRPESPLSVAPSGDVLSVEVGRPAQPALLSQTSPPIRIEQSAGTALLLHGADMPLRTIRVGEYLPITLIWQATDAPSANREVCFGLRSANTTPVDLGCQPLLATLPSEDWMRNDVWRAPYRIRMPQTLPGGLAEFVIRAETRDISVAPIEIQAPDRLRIAPPMTRELSLAFPPLAVLRGVSTGDSIRPGETLSITLLWEPTQTTEAKYTVFVHLIDSTGERKAGHDSQPDDGRQPVSTWLPGTYVRDVHPFVIPAELPTGMYRLRVGLYDTFSGAPFGQPIVLPGDIQISR